MNRKGFTLIELLIVVVIIGILAAIAVPKFSATKGKAFVSTMKSDLRNLMTSQEAYFYDNNIYYLGAIPNAAFPFAQSRDVTVTVTEGTAVGWAATAVHASIPAGSCAVFYGQVAAVPVPAVVEGEVACN